MHCEALEYWKAVSVRWQLWSLGGMRSRAHGNRELAHPCYRQSQVLTSSTRKGTVGINTWARCARATERQSTPLWPCACFTDLGGSPSFMGWLPQGSSVTGVEVGDRATQLPSGERHPPVTTLRSCILWGKSCRNTFSGCSHPPWKGENQAPLTEVFRKFGCYWEVWFLFPYQFPGEGAWGWIYTIRLFSPQRPGSLHWEFHFLVEACQSALGRSPVLVVAMGLVPVPWLRAWPSHTLTT